MVRKPDIQYIRQCYVPGSEARVLELKPKKKKMDLPEIQEQPQARPRPRRKQKVFVEPVALCGTFVLVVMLVTMLAGAFRFNSVVRENNRLEAYVLALENEKAVLQRDYENGYDLDQIRDMAVSLGMVPMEEVPAVPIPAQVPQPEPEPSWFQNLCWFVKELFA